MIAQLLVSKVENPGQDPVQGLEAARNLLQGHDLGVTVLDLRRR